MSSPTMEWSPVRPSSANSCHRGDEGLVVADVGAHELGHPPSLPEGASDGPRDFGVTPRDGRPAMRAPMPTLVPMAPLSTLLGDGPVLLDGGMGTLLQDRGLTDGGAGELWNAERPDVIRECHEEYARAGPGC